jgi:hypothetical protein
MTLKYWLGGAIGAVGLAMISLSAQAAPLAGANDGVQANAADSSMVQQARWYRHCYWHRGHRHCRRVWRGGYGYYPDRRYYGGPTVYGPGFGLYFGPRRHYDHW